MPAYESIVVVEDWISEHYFTSEDKGTTFQKAVRDLRKSWDADAKDGHSTVHRRFAAARGSLQTGMAALAELDDEEAAESAHSIASELRVVLGFPGMPDPQTFERGNSNLEVTGLWLGDTRDVLWLDGTPATGDDALAESTLLGTNRMDGKDRPDQPLSKLLSELYLSDPAPKYIVASVGGGLYLTERERWPEGRYLAADVQLIADRNDTRKGAEVDRLLAIFGRQSIMPGPDGTLWWDERLEESRQHAVGVSQDLRDGIRESIEIIANDVLQRRTVQDLDNSGVDGQQLARQSLRFLYRILFLLYAEASPELGVLPKGAGEYDAGYGLERLRDLVQVELQNHGAEQGTHLYDSLDVLFRLVNGNHHVHRLPDGDAPSGEDLDETLERDAGLRFEPLEADLFAPEATSLINEVGLGNAELQRVLERLLLSRAGRKGDRGFISYANLGISQLGAVYEGLMSYTGFIAADDLLEVAKNGDASKGSWVVPVSRSESIESKHFVRRANDETGIPEPVHHPQGSFVFRLAGRERQQSASFYTPEVLTEFVVSQALAELLDEDTSADRILELSICEPTLGSGAFAIEAVRQLADEYLKRKQRELGREIPAEEYPQELQRVKAQIALHQVHGVDLNSTAVELAEVSLWLETMQPELQAPWFGLRLKRGNSLVGARRATYAVDAVKAKKHLSEEPEAHPLTGLAAALEDDRDDPRVTSRIHHFLLPCEGWGAASGAKEVNDLAAAEQKKLKDWAKSTKKTLSSQHLKRLQALSQRVEVLWKITLRRLQIAETQARRFVDYWPHERAEESTSVSRAEIEEVLNDPNGAYQRLKRVMDAWNALWFWPLTEQDIEPPTVDQWLEALEGILGLPVPDTFATKAPRGERKSETEAAEERARSQTQALSAAGWNDLAMFEAFDFPLAQMRQIEGLRSDHPWLDICARIAEEQGFFHWELEFASVFAWGGFDLQVGNPPWVRPRSDEAALLAEHDPWWQLAEKPTQEALRQKRQETLAMPGAKRDFIESAAPTPVLADFLGSTSQYSVLAGLQPDLYRAFMVRTWRNSSQNGSVALIHPESHFTEKRAQNLRAATYRRLRRHWQFINELSLFEIDHHVSYGVHVYGAQAEEPRFAMAASLYHPDTVARSLTHEGGTEVPGLKTAEGAWDTRPHPERIIRVDMDILTVWADILDEPGTSPLHARMVYPVNRASMSVLEKLSRAPRVRELGLQYSRGWDESIDRKKGYFDVGSKINDSWNDVILQGPHFTVANPFYKEPNPTMKSNQDYVEIDLEALPTDFIPRTSYQPIRGGNVNYDSDFTHWDFGQGRESSTRFYRVAWRKMASTTGARTMHVVVLPKKAAHSEGTRSAFALSFSRSENLLAFAAQLASIPIDFLTRVNGIANLTPSVIEHLPLSHDARLVGPIARRFAPLVCLSVDYAELWYAATGSNWTVGSAARAAADRRYLQIEVDALVTLGLGLTIEELCTTYRTQFPVLRGYEQNDLYDANGRKIPAEMNKFYRKVGEAGMSEEDLRWVHPQSQVEYTFEFPFRSFDREEDMRAAYAKFSAMLEEHGEIIEDGV